MYLDMMKKEFPLLVIPPMRPEWLEIVSVSTQLQKKFSNLKSKLEDRFVEAVHDCDLKLLKKLSTTHKVSVDVVHKSTSGLTPLHLACRKGHLQVVQYLLEKKADIEKEDHKGRTAVYHAVKGNEVEVLKVLIGQGAELDKHRTKTKGLTALHKAVTKQHMESFQILIDNSCNVNLQVTSIILISFLTIVFKKI